MIRSFLRAKFAEDLYSSFNVNIPAGIYCASTSTNYDTLKHLCLCFSVPQFSPEVHLMLSANFVARATVFLVHVVMQMQCYAPQCCCKTAGILCTIHCSVASDLSSDVS